MLEWVPSPCTPHRSSLPPAGQDVVAAAVGWAGCGGGGRRAQPDSSLPQLLPPPPPGHVLSAWASTDYFPFSAEGHLKPVVMNSSCTTPFSCPHLQPRTKSLPSTNFFKARINSEEAPLNANDSPSCSAPPNPHPNFSPRAQTPAAAIDVNRASA